MAVLARELQDKLENLKRVISSYRKVVVAFSGGLDSGLVLYFAVDVLGSENVLPVTGDSPSLSGHDRRFGERFVETIGLKARHMFLNTNELGDSDYVANPFDRCYFCKRELFGKLHRLAEERGYDHVLDGSNASDADDHRPGRRAAMEFSIRSPLLEVGLSKREIREIAESEGLEISDKPQAACLASRIPYGEEITVNKLAMINQAEEYLRQTGFRQFRVRHHGRIARIELESRDFVHLLDSGLRSRIIDRFREIGFLWVTLDLKPFQTGSMNVMIEEGEDGEREH